MSIPKHYSPVMPYIVLADDADGFIAFIKSVFGAEEMLRVDHETGDMMHAEYSINGGTIMFGVAGGEWKASPCGMFVLVNDVDGTYEKALAQGADGRNGGVVRSSSMTLIALVDQEHDCKDLSETLAGLMRSHPNRAIVIHVSSGNSEELSAEVRAQCWLPTGQQKQLCSEQIEIAASEKSLADLPSVLLPLVVPEKVGARKP